MLAPAVQVESSHSFVNKSSSSCATANCSVAGTALKRRYPVAVVMPTHSQSAQALKYFHLSLVACKVEVAWFPVMSSQEQVELIRAKGLLTLGSDSPAQILPLIAGVRAQQVGIVAAPFKRWFGMRHVFCCYDIPYALAIDSEVVFVSPVTAVLLQSYADTWARSRRVIATGWRGRRQNSPRDNWEQVTEFAVTRMQLSALEQHELARIKRYYWWWSDLPIYERADFSDFFDR
jgi:hypothetical protein